jgi:hypothetical protein
MACDGIKKTAVVNWTVGVHILLPESSFLVSTGQVLVRF